MKHLGAKLATVLIVLVTSVMILTLKHHSFEEKFLTLDVDWKQAHSETVNHGIVIDCGSSGSRIYVYKWGNDGLKFELPVSKKVTPGLSELADNPENTANYLQPLLEFAKESIDSQDHSRASIFLMATAGMRLVDYEKGQQILANACKHVGATTDFVIQSCDINFRIITGEFEGFMFFM